MIVYRTRRAKIARRAENMLRKFLHFSPLATTVLAPSSYLMP
jgi:hypothetical protein